MLLVKLQVGAAGLLATLGLLAGGAGWFASRAPGNGPPAPSPPPQEKALPQEPFVAVAGYRANEPTVGERIGALLDAQKIPWVSAGSAGFTVSVPASRADKARRLIARAIKDEGLKAVLYQAFEVPARLRIRRTAERIAVGIDPGSLEEISLTVAPDRVIGMKNDLRVYRGKDLVVSGYSGLTGGTSDVGTTFLNRKTDRIPQKGETYVVEMRLAVFETDVPVQHEWAPESGKHFAVLWTRTLRAEVGPAEQAEERAGLRAVLKLTRPAGRLGADGLQIDFSLTNEGKAAVDPQIARSVLVVNGKQLDDSALIFGNGPRDARFTNLEAGGELKFSYALGRYFARPGAYRVVWKGEGFSSPPLEFRIAADDAAGGARSVQLGTVAVGDYQGMVSLQHPAEDGKSYRVDVVIPKPADSPPIAAERIEVWLLARGGKAVALKERPRPGPLVEAMTRGASADAIFLFDGAERKDLAAVVVDGKPTALKIPPP
jgi:hypothetical protein